ALAEEIPPNRPRARFRHGLGFELVGVSGYDHGADGERPRVPLGAFARCRKQLVDLAASTGFEYCGTGVESRIALHVQLHLCRLGFDFRLRLGRLLLFPCRILLRKCGRRGHRKRDGGAYERASNHDRLLVWFYGRCVESCRACGTGLRVEHGALRTPATSSRWIVTAYRL